MSKCWTLHYISPGNLVRRRARGRGWQVRVLVPFQISDLRRPMSLPSNSVTGICSLHEATEIAGVDNVAQAIKQGLKTQEWTSRHEEAGVDIARVDNVARRSKGGQRGSGQGGTKKQGWTTQE